jgi:hypothetical protein
MTLERSSLPEAAWARAAGPTFDFALADETYPSFARWLAGIGYDGFQAAGAGAVVLLRGATPAARVETRQQAGGALAQILQRIVEHRQGAAGARVPAALALVVPARPADSRVA